MKKFGHAYSLDDLVDFFLQNMEPRLSEHARVRWQEAERKLMDSKEATNHEKVRDELTALAKYMDTYRFWETTTVTNSDSTPSKKSRHNVSSIQSASSSQDTTVLTDTDKAVSSVLPYRQ